MKAPDHDATMNLLSAVRETVYREFKPILNNPDRLREWIRENLILPPEETPSLDPDDPTAAERAELSMETEDRALELWGELDKKERAAFRVAFLDLYGPEGAATLPSRIDD